MPRRDQWYYDLTVGLELTDLCAAVHGGTTGATELREREPERYEGYIRALRHALDRWEPSVHAKCAAYDDAVRTLVVATLNEV